MTKSQYPVMMKVLWIYYMNIAHLNRMNNQAVLAENILIPGKKLAIKNDTLRTTYMWMKLKKMKKLNNNMS
eukprot:UN16952